MVSSPSQPDRNTTAVSGWFRIAIGASAACVVAAAIIDDESFIDNFAPYFVISILTIVTLRILCFAIDWIAAGFSSAQLSRLQVQAKLIAFVGCASALVYLTFPAVRYGVVSAIGSDRTGVPNSFVVLDRVSGELYRVERIPDCQQKPRQLILQTTKF